MLCVADAAWLCSCVLCPDDTVCLQLLTPPHPHPTLLLCLYPIWNFSFLTSLKFYMFILTLFILFSSFCSFFLLLYLSVFLFYSLISVVLYCFSSLCCLSPLYLLTHLLHPPPASKSLLFLSVLPVLSFIFSFIYSSFITIYLLFLWPTSPPPCPLLFGLEQRRQKVSLIFMFLFLFRS